MERNAPQCYTVSVKNLAGVALLGPEAMPATTTVLELKQRIVALLQKSLIVKLYDGARELLDTSSLQDEFLSRTDSVVEISSLLLGLPWLSPHEREQLLKHIVSGSPLSVGSILKKYRELPQEARADHMLATSVYSVFPPVLPYVDVALRGNKEFMTELLELRPRKGFLRLKELLSCIAEPLRSDREFALYCVRKRGTVLEAFATEFRCDREIVINAVRNAPDVMPLAASELHSDPAFLAEAVMCNPHALCCISPELPEWPMLVSLAVQFFRTWIEAGGKLHSLPLSVRCNHVFLEALVESFACKKYEMLCYWRRWLKRHMRPFTADVTADEEKVLSKPMCGDWGIAYESARCFVYRMLMQDVVFLDSKSRRVHLLVRRILRRIRNHWQTDHDFVA